MGDESTNGTGVPGTTEISSGAKQGKNGGQGATTVQGFLGILSATGVVVRTYGRVGGKEGRAGH